MSRAKNVCHNNGRKTTTPARSERAKSSLARTGWGSGTWGQINYKWNDSSVRSCEFEESYSILLSISNSTTYLGDGDNCNNGRICTVSKKIRGWDLRAAASSDICTLDKSAEQRRTEQTDRQIDRQTEDRPNHDSTTLIKGGGALDDGPHRPLRRNIAEESVNEHENG